MEVSTQSCQELSTNISIYREFLSLSEQHLLIKELPKHFELFDADGEYNYPDNRGNRKGRCFRKISDWPSSLVYKLKEMKSVMEAHNPVFKYADFTHVLLNAYPSSIGMGWHQDDVGSHDGDKNAPVYTLSLGNSAIFIYRTFKKDVDHVVKLNSGDLLVFGGTLRRMYHSVKEVIPNTFEGCDNLRYNFTFRTCSNLTDEEYEAAQTEAYNLRRNKEFTKSRSERRKTYSACDS